VPFLLSTAYSKPATTTRSSRRPVGFYYYYYYYYYYKCQDYGAAITQLRGHFTKYTSRTVAQLNADVCRPSDWTAPSQPCDAACKGRIREICVRSHRDTAVPAEENGDLQTLICVLVTRPRRCSTLLNPVPWQNRMAAYLGYTLRMKTLFRGWTVMVRDTHTKRRIENGRIRQIIWDFLSVCHCSCSFIF